MPRLLFFEANALAEATASTLLVGITGEFKHRFHERLRYTVFSENDAVRDAFQSILTIPRTDSDHRHAWSNFL